MSVWLQKKLPLQWRRKFLLPKASQGVVKNYLQHEIPGLKQSINDTEFVVLDFETTGLDASRDEILSIGYTLIKERRVILRESRHQIVRPTQPLQKNNVVIHQITDTQADSGVELKEAIENLFQVLAGRVLIAHHADIEKGFINAACKRLYDIELPIRIVDTMAIEKRQLQRRHAGFKSNQLRLFNIRRHYGLPRYKAHNAMEDAIATAELFLVQLTHICGQGKCTLRDVIG